MTNAKPVCIIPARGGSKRFPRKNVALLLGKPLLAYTIEAAQASGVFDRVCVSSEDAEILQIAREYHAEALPRPEDLASDTAQVRHVCAHLLRDFAAQGTSYSAFGVLLVTNPLRTAQDIQAAYDLFCAQDADVVMSLVPQSHPPQRALWAPDGFVQPYFGMQYMQRAQVLEPLYRHDGGIILAKTAPFLARMEFYGPRVVPYFAPENRSVDIDSPLDLKWAAFLLSQFKG